MATSPFLAPDTTNNLNDEQLRNFLQQLIAGLTGIDGKYVRPRWQKNVGNAPTVDSDWISFGILNFKNDVFAYEGHVPDRIIQSQTYNSQGYNEGGFGGEVIEQAAYNFVHRMQEIEIMVTFYGPNAASLSDRFTLGLQLSTNREPLSKAGMALIECLDPVSVPTLLNELWQYAVDVRLRLRRQQVFKYAVPSIKATEIDLYFDDTNTEVTVPLDGGNIVFNG